MDPSQTAIERLMRAGNGPDMRRGRVSEPAWRDFVEHIAQTLDIGPGTSVFEVACSAGAFLYPFYENSYVVGGLDESAENIGMAEQAMLGGRFMLAQPSALDPADPWDVVVCSTFAMFSDLDYARGVLARMATKATHAVAILDIPDLDLKEADLDVLYFDRKWMLHALNEVGASAVQIEDLKIEGYSALGHFNVFARL